MNDLAQLAYEKGYRIDDEGKVIRLTKDGVKKIHTGGKQGNSFSVWNGKVTKNCPIEDLKAYQEATEGVDGLHVMGALLPIEIDDEPDESPESFLHDMVKAIADTRGVTYEFCVSRNEAGETSISIEFGAKAE